MEMTPPIKNEDPSAKEKTEPDVTTGDANQSEESSTVAVKSDEETPAVLSGDGEKEDPGEAPSQQDVELPRPSTPVEEPAPNTEAIEETSSKNEDAAKQSPPKEVEKSSEEAKDSTKQNGQAEKGKNQEGDKKVKKIQKIQVGLENLWVSNVSKQTSAKDLKHFFSKYGKVQGVKIVTSARSETTNCFGLVTMATPEEAQLCIKFLNNTELNGQLISIESAKQDGVEMRRNSTSSSVSAKRRSRSRDSERSRRHKVERKGSPERSSRSRRISPHRRTHPRKPSSRERALRRSRSPRRHRSPPPHYQGYSPVFRRSPVHRHHYSERSWSSPRRSPPPGRYYSESRPPPPSMLTFDMIREERLREQIKQRGQDPSPVEDKLLYLQEHNFKEMQRLEQEREQIKRQKEALERERAEILELEKLKQREMRLNIEKEMRLLEERKSKLQHTKVPPGYNILPPHSLVAPPPNIHWHPPAPAPPPPFSAPWMPLSHPSPYQHRPSIYDPLGPKKP